MKFSVLLLFLVASADAAPITLALSSANGSPTQDVDLALTLAGTSTATGLQWTLTYPTVDLASITFSIGTSAAAADKTLQCAPESGESITCLIFGFNQNIIATGPVATVRATIKQTPPDPIISLALSGLVATDAAGNVLNMTGAGGNIHVVPEPRSLSFLLVGLGFVTARRLSR